MTTTLTAYERVRNIKRAILRRAKTRGELTAEVVADFAWLHMRTADNRAILPAAHHWLWLRLMCDPFITRLLIIGTPESAKTTWALAYAACHIAFYPEHPLIIAAVSGPVAEKRSLALRNLIESAEFIETFPSVKPARGMPWTSTEWSVAEDGWAHPGRLHPTVSAYGTGGSVTGSRARLIIADDILDYDNTRTQHQRNLVDTWLHTSLLSRATARTGRTIIIGNAWHHEDSHMKLAKSEGWVTCRIPLLSDGPDVLATITYPADFAGQPIGHPIGVDL